ncbi:MAG TPA: DGQHR domain-containing protein [Candidatus Bathyarchaeia archaeon]|nr:DGQHR domain-containing protein [Candidatus Bathyarchaeia archaeon]
MKYTITDILNLFGHSGIQSIHIEGIRFDLLEKTQLVKMGKRRKREGTQGELDLMAYSERVVWLIEWTTQKWGVRENDSLPRDFDAFVQNFERLDQNRVLLKNLIDKVEKKFGRNLGIDATKCLLVGIYVDPYISSVPCKTLEGRIPRQQKSIFVWDSDKFEYFKAISGTIRKYARFELFDYFGLKPPEVLPPIEAETRRATVPFESIKIDSGVFGHTTFTFKISPRSLLERSYVLRNEGWRSDSFQRMVSPGKLASIRNYLIQTGNVSFANNIVISPSPQTDPDEIFREPEVTAHRQNPAVVPINLPYMFGSFCILDGQHRLMAFTQDFYGLTDSREKSNDQKIGSMAETSEIIATLVLFRGDQKSILKEQARLFRDINSNQTRVKSDFLYNLQEIIEPLDPEAIGNKTIRYLNDLDDGAFHDRIEIKSLPAYKGRIKRSSIVRWGLAELVDPKGKYFAKVFGRPVTENNLADYVQFCGDKLDDYFKAVREVFTQSVGKDIWGHWRRTGYMYLSSSGIVGFLRLYRHFVVSKLIDMQEKMTNRLRYVDVSFKKDEYLYTSSQWARLEAAMYRPISLKHPDFGDKALLKPGLLEEAEAKSKQAKVVSKEIKQHVTSPTIIATRSTRAKSRRA